MHAFLHICWTRDLRLDFPLVQIALWKHPTLNSLHHTHLCYSNRRTLMQNDQQLCWFQNLSTPSLNAFILSTCGVPLCSLLLTQTTTNVLDARYCNPDPSSYSNRLTLMQNAPQFYNLDPSSPHHTSTFILSWVLYKATWPSRWRNGKIITTSQVLLKNLLRISLLSSLQLYLRLISTLPMNSFGPPSYQLSTAPCPFAALLPTTSPHQCSSIPHHHWRRLFPALHNSPTKRETSPCNVCSSNGEIPAAKMTANKSKSKPQNMPCSHQWGDLLFGHTTTLKQIWKVVFVDVMMLHSTLEPAIYLHWSGLINSTFKFSDQFFLQHHMNYFNL